MTKDEKRAYMAKWRAENRDRVRATQLRWLAANEERTRATVKKWRETNRDKIREYEAVNREKKREQGRDYVRANREKMAESLRAWRACNGQTPERAEKEKARQALSRAIRKGRITKPETCETCGGNGLIHGHHDDYSKKLEVRWLCAPCHGVTHRVHP